MPPADPAPAPDSHEPAGRVDVPGAAPEWAVEMGRGLARTLANLPYATHEARVSIVARLLATLRERTLREAAVVCVHNNRGCGFNDDLGCHGQDSRAILSLIAQPPKDEGGAG